MAEMTVRVEGGVTLDPTASVSISNLPATQPVSGAVSVSNFPATQPVSGSVSVSNFPATQVVSGTVTSNETAPAAADVLGASRTTTGTLITVPAGRTFRGSLAVSCTIDLAGNSQPSISVAGTGISPAAGVLLQTQSAGLALAVAANSASLPIAYIYGGTTGATVTFTAGASGISSGAISGRLL